MKKISVSPSKVWISADERALLNKPTIKQFVCCLRSAVRIPNTKYINVIHSSVCLPACLPACLSVCLSVCLPACLPAGLPACLSACLSACMKFMLVKAVQVAQSVNSVSKPMVTLRVKFRAA